MRIARHSTSLALLFGPLCARHKFHQLGDQTLEPVHLQHGATHHQEADKLTAPHGNMRRRTLAMVDNPVDCAEGAKAHAPDKEIHDKQHQGHCCHGVGLAIPSTADEEHHHERGREFLRHEDISVESHEAVVADQESHSDVDDVVDQEVNREQPLEESSNNELHNFVGCEEVSCHLRARVAQSPILRPQVSVVRQQRRDRDAAHHEGLDDGGKPLAKLARCVLHLLRGRLQPHGNQDLGEQDARHIHDEPHDSQLPSDHGILLRCVRVTKVSAPRQQGTMNDALIQRLHVRDVHADRREID
mmetsp:Transcript_12261/g.33655  ORF Transcript_12261/g.33655 Transcript_12261/m.33655 type:complete len:301 (+) Transcript_12261:98-1000(+)